MQPKYLVIALAAMLLSGCTDYYMVKDPQTGKAFYTTSISQKKGQAVVFKDTVSGSQVTLQNSQVTEISKDEYKAAIAPPAK
jgi:PBP1b-binding outer membrane lipoprotein LpoB